MSITTVNDKIGIMEFCIVWESGLPISPGALGQDDQQQLIGGYPGVAWTSGGPGVDDFTQWAHHHVH